MFSASAWRKSARSAANGSCVEVALGADPAEQVGMRDSKNPSRLVLTFDVSTWQAFMADVKRGTFDRA